MRPMMRLVLGVVVLLGIMAVVAIGLPAHVTVARSVVINAPEYAVFPYLNNPRRFADWSPWHARDPNMVVTYSGPAEGKGAQVEWTSQKKSIGAGSMEIVESEPSRNIDMVVDYNGVEGTSSYQLAPAGSGSKVTWSLGYETGSSPLKRWKGLMLDGLVGAEYNTGLANLKARIEEDRRPMAPTVGAEPPAAAVPAGEGEAQGEGAASGGGPSGADAQQAAPATSVPERR